MELRYQLLRVAVVAVCSLLVARTTHAQEPVSQSATDAHEAFIGKLKKSIFEISAKTVSAQVFATGTGFVVSDDGLAFTNFHVLHGASAATATFTDDPRTHEIELLAVDPALDLALIRLVPPGIGTERREFIPVSANSPVEGTTVWAIGYPKRLGFSVSKGVVNGVRSYSALPAALRAELNYRDDSEWIQTDATINAGNSGGPLVASDGSVVGVNTWVWLEGSNLFFAISASHLRPLMAKAADPPLGFERAAREHGTVRTIVRTVPRLEIVPIHEPSAAIRRSTELDKFFLCTRCGGNGRVERRVFSHYERGGGLRTAVYKNVAEPCDACKRTGFGDLDRSAAGLCRLISEVVQVQTADAAKCQRAVESVVERFKRALDRGTRGEPVWWNNALVEISGKGSNLSGEPVWYYGVVAEDLEIRGLGRHRIVQLKGAKISVVLTELQYADAAPAHTVFGIGYFAGRLSLKDGTVVPVIQGGMLLKMP